ncbi:hypothetical protein [Hymenobacter sp. PAMC 26628]|uniref:hypothetical protein n=1 Tax=Hymenobacter sp. PAMC 26628 TaxID=1484118 RepID=UPI0007702E68|nr:hypothetical protein [Hymenobacter sp. PAMC 26628]AMJ67195.1 hypothetical protein AXW84_18490 [Hymenobacter sp. PAMC 26628]
MVAEVTARRRCAARYGLRSGALPVLAAVGALAARNTAAIQPAHLHAAGLMSASLLRSYVRELCMAGLVERYTRGGTRYLCLAAPGVRCLAWYQRALRSGAQAYFSNTRIG